MLELRFCPVCQDETDVELVPCPDGHGEGCTEWVCLGCSAAIFGGVVTITVRRRASAA